MNKYNIKAIIVEDEENGRLVLIHLLEKHCPNVTIAGTATTVKEAIPLIIKETPDVVFLDIELPEGNGFTLFDHFPLNTFKTIFVTAYSQYALKALKLAAIDYLLKPIDPDELIIAVGKLDDKQSKENADKLQGLLHNFNSNLSKIALPTQEGLTFVDMNNLIRCEAEGNYTHFHLVNGEKILISKTLAYFEDVLDEGIFFRSNRTTLVNMNFISKFQRGRKSYVILEDGTEIHIPDNRKEEFISKFTK